MCINVFISGKTQDEFEQHRKETNLQKYVCKLNRSMNLKILNSETKIIADYLHSFNV